MKSELRRDVESYGVLILFLSVMVLGMFKCTRHVDRIAARYNSNQDAELSQLKQAYIKQKKK